MTRAKGRRPPPDKDQGIEEATLLILEWLGERGVGAMIRVDAARLREGRPAWTFAAGGGPLKLVESAQARRRAVTGAHLVALVRAGATFENGVLVEREGEAA